MRKNDAGAGLLETAVAMPLLFGIAFNIINLAYFWFVVLTLTAAPRVGVQFSAQFSATSVPTAGQVNTLVMDNMTNAVSGATTSNTAVRVCSKAIGVDSNNNALCSPFGASFTFPAVGTDPEPSVFVLNRVDVEYTVRPLIPGSAFGVLLPTNLQFKRQVSMRALY
jgi:Flp pilus assembly protein TadG